MNFRVLIFAFAEDSRTKMGEPVGSLEGMSALSVLMPSVQNRILSQPGFELTTIIITIFNFLLKKNLKL
jgi:hypothetical protein